MTGLWAGQLAPLWLSQGDESLRSRFIAVFDPIKPLEEDFMRFIDGPR
jgi:hypothetical protein